jgi:hypothetical protein
VELAGVPIRTCPAFTINLDFREFTTLPPGYRTYEFHDNGDVTECHLLDGGPWKRHKLPKPAAAWLMGEIVWDEMQSQIRRPD